MNNQSLGINDLENSAFSGSPFQTDLFQHKVHLRLYRRNARQTITIIEGLDLYPEIDLKKFLGYAKKKLSCNGSLKKTIESSSEATAEAETIILVQLQGDHRGEISLMLQHRYHIERRNIIVHGY